MAYSKNTWVARQGTGLNRFEKQNETATHVELVNDPTSVSVSGTAFNDVWMNNIEDALEISIDTSTDEQVKAGGFKTSNGTNFTYLATERDYGGTINLYRVTASDGYTTMQHFEGGTPYTYIQFGLNIFRVSYDQGSTYYNVITSQGNQTIDGKLTISTGGADFTGTFYNRGVMYVGYLGTGGASPLRLSGSSTGIANTCYISIYESNSTNRVAYIGFPSAATDALYIRNERNTVSSYVALQSGRTSQFIQVGDDGANVQLRPASTNTGSVGTNSQTFFSMWSNAYNGASSARFKYNIAYLDGSPVPPAYDARDVGDTYVDPTVADIVNFVKNTYKPAIFTREDANLDTDPNIIELGFIADDFDTDPVYQLAGSKYTIPYEEGIDDEGNTYVVNDGGTTHGINAHALTNLALVALQDALKTIETLESQVTTLESEVTTLQGQVSTLETQAADFESRITALEGA